MLTVEQLKTTEIDFARIADERERAIRVRQFAELKAGTLSARLLGPFCHWLVLAISDGRAVPREPSLLKKAKNLSKASRVHFRSGARKVVPEVRAERLSICRTCELYNPDKGTCRHPDCGCVMSRKTRWATSECPIGRWGAIQNPDFLK